MQKSPLSIQDLKSDAVFTMRQLHADMSSQLEDEDYYTLNKEKKGFSLSIESILG